MNFNLRCPSKSFSDRDSLFSRYQRFFSASSLTLPMCVCISNWRWCLHGSHAHALLSFLISLVSLYGVLYGVYSVEVSFLLSHQLDLERKERTESVCSTAARRTFSLPCIHRSPRRELLYSVLFHVWLRRQQSPLTETFSLSFFLSHLSCTSFYPSILLIQRRPKTIRVSFSFLISSFTLFPLILSRSHSVVIQFCRHSHWHNHSLCLTFFHIPFPLHSPSIHQSASNGNNNRHSSL